jgi:hypothetical protein
MFKSKKTELKKSDYWTDETVKDHFDHFVLPADSPMAVEGKQAGLKMMESTKTAGFGTTTDGKSRGTMCSGGKLLCQISVNIIMRYGLSIGFGDM